MENRNDEPFLRQLLNLICDLAILGVCFLVCSLPVITIGASLSAMYYALLRLIRGEGSVAKDFFKAFREDFRQATPAFLLVAVIGAALWADYYFLAALNSITTWVLVLLIAIAFWVLAISAYIFPLIAQFRNKFLRTLRNAILLSLTNFPKTILLIALNLIVPAVALFATSWLVRLLIFFLLFGFSVPAYFSALLLGKIFKPYLEQATQEQPEKPEES